LQEIQVTDFIDIEVAVPTPVPQTFTYQAPGSVLPGTRVLVPFGARQLVGVCMAPAEKTKDQGFKLKRITDVLDEKPIYSPTLLELAKWLSRYYLHPLGEVLRTMLPAGTVKVAKVKLQLSDKGRAARLDEKHQHHLILKKLFAKDQAYLQASLQSKWRKIKSEMAGEKLDELAKLVELGLLLREASKSVRARRIQKDDETDGNRSFEQVVPPELTDAQKEVLRTIVEQGVLAGSEMTKRPFLLRGVTGSGKTEVYLAVIDKLLAADQDAQVLVMVPEIALTPQMTRLFTARFSQVAVVHSAMADNERWQELRRVHAGEARVLIGPRSAVFAPFCRLKLLIVDEEHDSSYKQATGLTYNGRDVAVLRAQMEGATVLLGSATPSMESYHNAQAGKYHLLELSERVLGRPLPQIQVIRSELKPNKLHETIRHDDSDGEQKDILDRQVIDALRANLAEGKQAIVLVNRRGYAFYLFNPVTKETVNCPNCSISLTLHARRGDACCHYCDYRISLTKIKAQAPEVDFLAVGYGSQKVETFLNAELPQARILRIDSDTMHGEAGSLPKSLEAFRQGEVDILVGTQILAKGHDFPNVTLIALVELDQQLSLPDFRAGERTFQLIVQAAGRAGRAKDPGFVLLQTSRAENPIVQMGLRQDFLDFAGRELEFRRANGYPPFARMIAFELSSQDARQLGIFADSVGRWWEEATRHNPGWLKAMKVLGPSVPGIEMVRRRHRRQLILISANQGLLWQAAGHFLRGFSKLPNGVRLRVDVDPQSLL